jgi:putative DNA primase/helicase
MVRYLASLPAIEYEQKRKAVAEALGVRASALDRAVKEAGQGKEENSLPFEEPDPWPDPVEPGELLTEIATTIQRFIVCTDFQVYTFGPWGSIRNSVTSTELPCFMA